MITRRAEWWPVDKVILAYFGATMALEIAFWNRIPDSGMILLAHCAAIALILLVALRPGSRTGSVFHHWYPLPYVFACYREMSILIPALERPSKDAGLASLDRRLWGANPTVWLERLRTPILAEALQIVYSLFCSRRFADCIYPVAAKAP